MYAIIKHIVKQIYEQEKPNLQLLDSRIRDYLNLKNYHILATWTSFKHAVIDYHPPPQLPHSSVACPRVKRHTIQPKLKSEETVILDVLTHCVWAHSGLVYRAQRKEKCLSAYHGLSEIYQENNAAFGYDKPLDFSQGEANINMTFSPTTGGLMYDPRTKRMEVFYKILKSLFEQDAQLTRKVILEKVGKNHIRNMYEMINSHMEKSPFRDQLLDEIEMKVFHMLVL